jgi:hypothetical protein
MEPDHRELLEQVWHLQGLYRPSNMRDLIKKQESTARKFVEALTQQGATPLEISKVVGVSMLRIQELKKGNFAVEIDTFQAFVVIPAAYKVSAGPRGWTLTDVQIPHPLESLFYGATKDQIQDTLEELATQYLNGHAPPYPMEFRIEDAAGTIHRTPREAGYERGYEPTSHFALGTALDDASVFESFTTIQGLLLDGADFGRDDNGPGEYLLVQVRTVHLLRYFARLSRGNEVK